MPSSSPKSRSCTSRSRLSGALPRPGLRPWRSPPRLKPQSSPPGARPLAPLARGSGHGTPSPGLGPRLEGRVSLSVAGFFAVERSPRPSYARKREKEDAAPARDTRPSSPQLRERGRAFAPYRGQNLGHEEASVPWSISRCSGAASPREAGMRFVGRGGGVPLAQRRPLFRSRAQSRTAACSPAKNPASERDTPTLHANPRPEPTSPAKAIRRAAGRRRRPPRSGRQRRR